MTIKDELTLDEGRKKLPYVDTMGKISIGIGRNLTDNGLSDDEIDYLYNNDINRCKKELAEHDFYFIQPPGVQDALLNMNFNLGISRLLEFKQMISALELLHYEAASYAALDSLWAKQVGDRAVRLAAMMRGK